MSDHRDSNNSQHNSVYYNQMLRASERKRPKRSVVEKSFASKKVDFSKYLIVPSNYEGLAYTLYFLLIPYAVGMTFLFFYVAKAAYESFALLDLSSAILVWLIGYEITAGVILFFIFISFLKHLKNSK